eukprot:TRINITY_DN3381_c0_g3_i1.p1 TRINITY_DN3381_c0_g3~~TRINITY_DN3381_c0_g3_i1.p1  ORF type:complete len:501 (+),score=135.20 TRINITY_DN3381_c0_g3_i1:173-1504(+)
MKVACVEKRGTLGGTCLNVGCIPSKALLHSSHLYHEAKSHFATHGIKVGDIHIDLPAMMKQKMDSVNTLTRGVEGLFKKNKVTYVKGHGTITDPNTIAVDALDGSKPTLKTDRILIATGSEISSIPNVTIDEKRILSSTGALSLSEVPKKLIVVGGGYIGLEMGSVWRRLGAQVEVIEFLDNIVPSMDVELRTMFHKSLQKQGMSFRLGTKVTSAMAASNKVTLHVEPVKGDGKKETLEADYILVSTGRRPNTDGLGIQKLGVALDKVGRVVVDDHTFVTNIPSIFAIGDVIRGPMLAHKAEEEGVACVEWMAGLPGHVNYDAIPSVVYTSPEVASVGKTEQELKELGIKYKVGKFPMLANSRARTNAEVDGMVKVLTEEETDRLLGVHIMCQNAGEMIAEAVLAIEYGASAEDVARTCHPHPTLSEAVKEACMAAYDKPINF